MKKYRLKPRIESPERIMIIQVIPENMSEILNQGFANVISIYSFSKNKITICLYNGDPIDVNIGDYLIINDPNDLKSITEEDLLRFYDEII